MRLQRGAVAAQRTVCLLGAGCRWLLPCTNCTSALYLGRADHSCNSMYRQLHTQLLASCGTLQQHPSSVDISCDHTSPRFSPAAPRLHAFRR